MMVETTKSATRKGSPASKNKPKNAARKMPAKKVSGTSVNSSLKNPKPVRQPNRKQLSKNITIGKKSCENSKKLKLPRPQNKKQLSKNIKIGKKSCENSKKLKSPVSSSETSKGRKNTSAKTSKSAASTKRQSKKPSQVTKNGQNGVKKSQISKKPSKLSNQTTSSKQVSKKKSANAAKKSKSKLPISKSKGHGTDVRTPQMDLLSRLFSSTSNAKSVGNDTRVAPGTLMPIPSSSLMSEFQEQEQRSQRPPETNAFNVASSSPRPDSRREEVRRLLLEILTSKSLPSANKSTISEETRRKSPEAQTSHASTLTSTSQSREEIRSILMDIIASGGGNSISRPANPAATKQAPSRNRPTKSAPSMKKVIRKSNAVSPARVVNEKDSCSEMNNQRIGFDRNLEPSHIEGMTEFDGDRYFMMKWKGSEMRDMVPVQLANVKCPQLVIKFYESRLVNVFPSNCI